LDQTQYDNGGWWNKTEEESTENDFGTVKGLDVSQEEARKGDWKLGS